MKDLVLTWPKTTPLRAYVAGLEQAAQRNEVINYRVANPPTINNGNAPRLTRVYMVHDGFIRGWSTLIGVEWRGAGVVRDRGGGFWPEGWYIVRHPDWHPIELRHQIKMRGFQGFRYIERTD